MYRVDVVMSTYNGEKYVKEQIESVLNNQGCEVFLHIFDDGSQDYTMEILKEYKKQYPRLITVQQNEHNLGVTNSFLRGIQTVMENNHEAQYFMCCDQDDVWNNDKIKKTLKRMKQMEQRFGEERPILVFTDASVTDDQLNELQSSFYKSQYYQINKLDLPHLLMENKCIGCTTMINRSYEPYLLQLPKQARYHDWWLALIAATFGNISFLPRQTMRYRQHSNNVVGGAKFSSYFTNRIKNLKTQKLSLLENKKQAEEFLLIFKDTLSIHKKSVIELFIQVYQMSWLKQRYVLIHEGYLKSGIVRNLGLLLVF